MMNKKFFLPFVLSFVSPVIFADEAQSVNQDVLVAAKANFDLMSKDDAAITKEEVQTFIALPVVIDQIETEFLAKKEALEKSIFEKIEKTCAEKYNDDATQKIKMEKMLKKNVRNYFARAKRSLKNMKKNAGKRVASLQDIVISQLDTPNVKTDIKTEILKLIKILSRKRNFMIKKGYKIVFIKDGKLNPNLETEIMAFVDAQFVQETTQTTTPETTPNQEPAPEVPAPATN
ncbi:MAG: hypothetical protein V1855_01200 [bacterium]